MIDTGIHIGLGMEDYHAYKLDKSNLAQGPISSSTLKQFSRNPYAWLRSEDKQPTASMQTGSLLDMALTEPHRFESCVVPSPYENYRSKDARAWRDETLAGGMLIASQVERENAKACAAAVRSHDVAGSILQDANFQVGAVAKVGDIPAKCLVDIVPGQGEWEEHLFDYKTTSNGLDDENIRKTIGQWKYHFQAAFYRSVFNKASKDRLCEKFGFIFQDPMTREVRVVVLDDDSLALGTKLVSQALQDFTRCAYRGINSRYAKSASTLGVMPYQAMADEDFLITLEQEADQ